MKVLLMYLDKVVRLSGIRGITFSKRNFVSHKKLQLFFIIVGRNIKILSNFPFLWVEMSKKSIHFTHSCYDTLIQSEKFIAISSTIYIFSQEGMVGKPNQRKILKNLLNLRKKIC